LPADWRAYASAVALSIASFFLFSLALKLVHPLHHVQQVIRAYRPSEVHGSARFANKADIRRAGLNRDRGLWIGQFEDQVLRYENETHTLVISPAGGGKTVYLVIPQLGAVDMPMLITDMKGELTAVSAVWRVQHLGHRVRIINPPGDWPIPTDSYNPCDLVVEATLSDPRDALDNANNIALQLLPEPPRADANQHFRDGSRKIIAFTIAAVACDSPSDCNLPTIEAIVNNPDAFRALCDKMKDAPDLQGVIANRATRYLSEMDTTQKEWGSFINGATQALAPFNKSGRIAQLCTISTFRFSELQTGDEHGRPVTIYNCCDQSRTETFKPWIGLLNWAAMTELLRTPKQRRILILLDEAGNFKVNQLGQILTNLRGYGVTVMMVFQDHSQIEEVYGKPTAETIWGQSQLKIAFGIRSTETAKKFSELAGERTVETESTNQPRPGDPLRINVTRAKRPLITPNEIQTLPPDRMIVFTENLPLIMATRCGYHEIEPMRSGLLPNPFHGNQPYRGHVRVIL
jgi:type IV secretory pathway TraG/TraD family ATPase VirD4